MQLYSDTLLNELAGKKAVADSILSQMASGPSRQILHHINTLYDAVGSPVQDRWSESLRSTDNRKFFQGFGEAISAAFMARAGWRIADVCSLHDLVWFSSTRTVESCASSRWPS